MPGEPFDLGKALGDIAKPLMDLLRGEPEQPEEDWSNPDYVLGAVPRNSRISAHRSSAGCWRTL
jgi:hypothetical protein